MAASTSRRRWLLRTLFIAYLAVLGELAARGYWALKHGVPFFAMDQIFVDRFYPELRESGVLDARIARDDGVFDVLLLGGSTMTDEFGTIRKYLQQHLEQVVSQPVRTFNCASCGMTSRDSRLKYELLADKEFDLVVLYDGINDVRMNNCPSEMYRADYSHGSFYHRLNRLRAHREVNLTVLPYTLEYLAIGLLDSRLVNRYLPRNPPDDGHWFEYGDDLKTVASFRDNERAIVNSRHDRGAEVVLPTYAYYIPANYSREGVRAQSLDYATHSAFVEMWGTPRAVAAAIDAQNAAMSILASEYDHASFADIAGQMPPGKRFFNDVCHLSTEGCQAWVAMVRPALDRRLAQLGKAREPVSNNSPSGERIGVLKR